MIAPADPAERPAEASTAPRSAWRTGVRGFVVEWGSLGLAIVVLTAALRLLVAQAFYIPSGSMLPQLQLDDRIVVSKLSYRLHEPRRGDIVVFDAPASMVPRDDGDDRPLPIRAGRALLEGVSVVKPEKTEFVKRVIGLPGERVEARNGNVYVDGALLVEPYLRPGLRTGDFEPRTVPPDHLFVMGDNRVPNGSVDSRVFGPIPQREIVGRAFVKLWPAGSASWL